MALRLRKWPASIFNFEYEYLYSNYLSDHFCHKNRERVLSKHGREELFAYISEIIRNKNCFVYKVGGVEDHLHIVTHLHPTVSLSSLVKDIKLASSQHIKSTKLFPNFVAWQEGYGAFTYTSKEKDRLIKYVANQEEHHKTKDFRSEYIEFLNEHGISFEEKYLP